MSYDGPTPTKLGRIQSVPPMQLHRMHVAAPPATLREVSWTIPIPVLDQEDLRAQSISAPALVKGAADVDALGSCTCQAGTAHLAERLTAAGGDIASVSLPDASGNAVALSGTSSRADEEFAILLYHLVTSQTGDPASEWPPADAGSSGYYVAGELEKLLEIAGGAASYKTASGVAGALSLLQSGTVMIGMPWLNSFFSPDAEGFIDGDGSRDALMAALESGVAGGHETLIYGIPQLAVTGGAVDLANTAVEVRNSWSAGFGLGGSFRVHASTLDYLAAYTDYKQSVIFNAP